MASAPDNSISSAKAHLGLLFSTHPAGVAVFLGLTCFLGLIDGVGILLLVPLLELVGVGGEASGIAKHVASLFQLVGLSPSISNVLITFVVLVVGHACFSRWARIARSELELSFGKSLQDRLHEAITRSRWRFYVGTRSSDFTHALTSNLDRVSTGTFYFLRLLSTALLTLVHTAFAVLISPGLAVLCLGCFLLLWRILGRQNRAAMRTGEQVTKITETFFARMADHLAGMKEVKALGAEERHLATFQETTSSMVDAWHRYTRSRENTVFIYTVGSASLLAGLLYVAVAILMIPLAELMVLIFVFSRLIPRLRDIHVSYQQILHALPALASARDLQRRCELAAEPAVTTRVSEVTLTSEIRLRNVSFHYGNAARNWPLRDINVEFPARGTTAIVGPSGAGKSTLAELLLGLMSPTAGSMEVDGVTIDDERLATWRRMTGFVPQTTFLLHDTIRRNLLWGAPDASEAELSSALSAAAAEDFVNALPDGLDTLVGDRGVSLSGGERQRIAMARALLRQPDVLILDEATSELDAENQARIQQAIQRLRGALTIIIVAHRLSTVRMADRVVVLDSGKIVEEGSFDELAGRTDGRFRRIMAAEGLGFEGEFSSATARID